MLETPAPGIEVRGLTKSYGRGKVPAVVELELSIEAGEIFGIIGPNGAGKTTFIGLALGLLRPDRGSIVIDGKPPEELAVRAATGYLPERLDFDRWMTGRDLVLHQHALAAGPQSGRGEEAARLLDRVGLPQRSWDQRLATYSRGMLQRLGLAQAMVCSPRYLFLDEPSSGVDPAGAILFREILLEQKRAGVTVVLNSHQLSELEQVCDRVAYLEGGQVRAIEDLRQAQAGGYVLAVRFLPGSSPPRASLVALAHAVGATLLAESGRASAAGDDGARFALSGDAQSASLLRALFESGAAVVAAAPESGRLERHFSRRPGDA